MIRVRLARRVASTLLALVTALAMAVLAAPPASAADDCQHFSMSDGVYHSTSYEYANHWVVTPDLVPKKYEWYLRRLFDDSIALSGSAIYKISFTTSATTYRMQIHHVSGGTNGYKVCFSVV